MGKQGQEWADISLDEINTSNMTPPELEKTSTMESGSSQRLYPSAQPSRGFWGRRSGMEKMMLAVVGVMGVAAVATGCFYAFSPSPNAPNSPISSEVRSTGIKAEETCTTPECVIAAGHVLESMDQSADPCDDFFRFACGGWVDNNVIPESASRWGKFYELREKVDQANRVALEAPIELFDPQAVKNVKNLYTACLDTAEIENAGYGKFNELVWSGEQYGGWPMIQGNSWDESKFSTEKVVGKNFRRFGVNSLMTVYPSLDNYDTSKYVLQVDQPSLALPRDFYLDTDTYSEYVEAYKNYIFDVAKVMARETGSSVTDAELVEHTEELFAFEYRLARGVVPDSERRNATEMYNPLTFRQLQFLYPIYWDQYFSELFADTDITVGEDETLILVEPEFFDWLLPLMIATPANIMADYLYWNRIRSLVSEGPQEFVDIQFQFNSVLYGQSSPSPRWSQCVAKASSEDQGFAYAVGREYIEGNFDEDTKLDAEALVEDLRASFKDLVSESVWMDSATQVKAQEKADQIIQLTGYPTWAMDDLELDARYANFPETSASTHFENIAGVTEAYIQTVYNSLRKTPDRNEWITQPAIVNAFYAPNYNTISFPAGILQPPFFGKGYPRYLNYGAIGVVMGHEITHGFDDNGRQYNGLGELTQWWSDETIEAFTNQAQCYVDQYASYVIDELVDQLGEDAHINGVNTLGENIADNGGVHEAFNAYQRSVAAQGTEGPLPGLEQYTSEQMFFIGYAQVWCEKSTTEGLLNQILTDPHSPGKYRVWGPLSNSPDFVNTFNCPAGSNMNRPDSEKCVLW